MQLEKLHYLNAALKRPNTAQQWTISANNPQISINCCVFAFSIERGKEWKKLKIGVFRHYSLTIRECVV